MTEATSQSKHCFGLDEALVETSKDGAPKRALVVVEGLETPKWAAHAINNLSAQGWELDCAHTAFGSNRRSLAQRLYAGIERLKFAVPDDARSSARPHQTLPWLQDLPAHDQPCWHYCIYLGHELPLSELIPLAQIAVIYTEIGSQRKSGWEDYSEEHPATSIRLKKATPSGDISTLFEAHAEVDVRSVTRTENRALWTAATLITPGLIETDEPPSVERSPPAGPGTVSTADVIRAARTFGRRYLEKKRARKLGEERWLVELFCRKTGDARRIEPPVGENYADPLIHEIDGKDHLYFEAYENKGRGRILTAEVMKDGTVAPPQEAISADYHLSFPFAFSWEGRHFMIPESSENRTIDLWECDGHPAQWSKRETLLGGVDAVDTTLHEQDGLWWMFVSERKHPATSYHDSLFLYFAETPLGPWQPHRNNPLKLDVQSSRNAGPLFSYQGRLIRPAQDCRSRYGAGIVLNLVHTLSPEKYVEEPYATIRPTGTGDNGLHTLCLTPSLIAIDRRVRGAIRPEAAPERSKDGRCAWWPIERTAVQRL